MDKAIAHTQWNPALQSAGYSGHADLASDLLRAPMGPALHLPNGVTLSCCSPALEPILLNYPVWHTAPSPPALRCSALAPSLGMEEFEGAVLSRAPEAPRQCVNGAGHEFI